MADPRTKPMDLQKKSRYTGGLWRGHDMDVTKRKTIEGWIDKASNQLMDAEIDAKSPDPLSDAIQAAQQCVELSVKSVLALEAEYPRAHEWPPESKALAGIALQIRQRQLLPKLQAQHVDQTVRLPRLLMLMNFWSQFYLVAKYGFETELLASAQELFDMEDAGLDTPR